MSRLRMEAGDSVVEVDPLRGGRLAALEVDGWSLIRSTPDLGPLQWGAYPMVPWSGRLRHGRFVFAGAEHRLPCDLPPHAIHGTGYTRRWEVVEGVTAADGAVGVELALDLGPPWPLGGRARHRLELTPERLRATLVVEADRAMPAMVGWHPWFVRRPRRLDGTSAGVEVELRVEPGAMYELDNEAIPTGHLVDPAPAPWDNCFTDLADDPVLVWPGLVELRLSSSCDHWVLYTEPEDALCVEPQTGAPDAFNRTPEVIPGGGRLEAWFEVAWA